MSLKTIPDRQTALPSFSNRRSHSRKDIHAGVSCLVRDTFNFPGLRELLNSKWLCMNLSQGGMLLEARVQEMPETAQSLDWAQAAVFPRRKGAGRVYYPALPPEKLKVSVEIRFPRKRNSFTFHGALAWFKHLAKGIYRMGVRFDPGQDFHIYEDSGGRLVMAVIWRESDLLEKHPQE